MTDANPFINEYAWSPKKVLVDYTTSKGHKLQGTLMLPAGYEPGKKYPMLVEFYEIMSNTHHNFSTPGYSNSPQLSTYASNGYLVFQPDIVYEIGKPGTSARRLHDERGEEGDRARATPIQSTSVCTATAGADTSRASS